MNERVFAPTVNRYVSPRQLRDATGLSEATLWRMRRNGTLPAPIRLSPGRVGWPEDVIEQWLKARAVADVMSHDDGPEAA